MLLRLVVDLHGPRSCSQNWSPFKPIYSMFTHLATTSNDISLNSIRNSGFVKAYYLYKYNIYILLQCVENTPRSNLLLLLQ